MRYIHRVIAVQRGLDLTGRVLLALGSRRSAWWAGTAAIALAKIIENMEIGHNVIHGQWDWMNDPEIHSTWEWDMAGVAKHWQITHNHSHHKYTNILDMDDDVGYGLLRVTRDQPWRPRNLLNVLQRHAGGGLRMGNRAATLGDRQDRRSRDQAGHPGPFG